MKVTSDKVENSQAYLTIEIEPAEVEESMQKTYTRLVKNSRIPGFRKGKAPRAIFERYVGRESLREDALDTLIPEACKKAVTEKNIDVFGQPVVEVAQEEPVILKVVVPLKPTVKLGDYRGLNLEPEPVNVTEENVDAAIGELRHQHATWEPAERPVAEHDLVSLDVASRVESQTYIDRKNTQFQIVPGFPLPAPGFSEALTGMKRDEEKEFKLKFPEDYPRPELANKEAEFKVKVLEIKKEKLPELNDDFVKMVNPDLKDLKELHEKVMEDIKRQLEEQAKSAFENKVIETVASQSQLEYPPVLVEFQVNQLIRERIRELETDERGFQDYLKAIKKTEPEFREEMKPLATRRVINSLVLGKVAEEEKVAVSEEEVNTEIERLVQSAAAEGREKLRQYLNTPESRESIHDITLTHKTIEKLVEIARGTEGSKEAEAKAEAAQEEKK